VKVIVKDSGMLSCLFVRISSYGLVKILVVTIVGCYLVFMLERLLGSFGVRFLVTKILI